MHLQVSWVKHQSLILLHIEKDRLKHTTNLLSTVTGVLQLELLQ
jgi:hypothetical protein